MKRSCILLLLLVLTARSHATPQVPLPETYLAQHGLAGVTTRYDSLQCERLIGLFDSLFYKQRVHMYDHIGHPQWEYLFESTRQLARSSQHPVQYNQLSFRLMIILHRQTKYRQVIPIMETLLRYSGWTRDQENTLLKRMEQAYRWSGMFKQALVIRQVRIQKGFINNFWEMYDAIGAHADAIQEYRLKEPAPEGKPFALAQYYNWLGVLYMRNKQYDSALVQFKTMRRLLSGIMAVDSFPGMDQYAKLGRPYFYDLANGQIGRIYALQGKCREAIPLLEQDINTSRRFLEVDNRIVKWNVLVPCLMHTGQMAAAKRCLDSVRILMQDKAMIEEQLAYLRNLSDWHRNKGNKLAFLDTYEQFITLRDSLVTDNQRNQTIFTLANLDVQRNRLALQQQAYQVEVAQFKARQSLRIIVVLSLLSIIVILVYINKRRKQRYEQEAAVLQERYRISSDLHDDISANLSALYLYTSSIGTVADVPAVQEKIGTVNSRIKELSNQLREVIWSVNVVNDNLDGMIYYIMQQVSELLRAKAIKLRFHAPDDERCADVRIKGAVRRHLYLSVKEGAHNIIKHAQATEAELTFALLPGCLQVELRDNGIGMQGVQSVESSGMRNMQQHMAAIGGTLAVRSNGGVALVFTLPLK